MLQNRSHFFSGAIMLLFIRTLRTLLIADSTTANLDFMVSMYHFDPSNHINLK